MSKKYYFSLCSIFPEPGYYFKISDEVSCCINDKFNTCQSLINEIKRKLSNKTLGVVVSTDGKNDTLEVKGPTIDKEGDVVDYVIWIPYDSVNCSDDYLKKYLDYLFEGILYVFKENNLSETFLNRIYSAVKREVIGNPDYDYRDSEAFEMNNLLDEIRLELDEEE